MIGRRLRFNAVPLMVRFDPTFIYHLFHKGWARLLRLVMTTFNILKIEGNLFI